MIILGGGIVYGTLRRKEIVSMLEGNGKPLSGTYLAGLLKVSRQVIVQDIAILRAEGKGIIATPQGYFIPDYSSSKKTVKRVIACIHTREEIGDELKTIISMGGRVIDVLVEHPVYGELRGMLMLLSIYDADEFVKKLKEGVGQPLLVLTAGVHLHTIEAESEEKLNMIEERLKNKGYLLDSRYE